MKAQRFKGRDRQRPGRTTGSVECDLEFPLTEEKYNLRPFGRHAFKNARKFILKHLADRQAVLEGAHFTLYAEVRTSTGNLGRSKLVRWTYGEDLERAFSQATVVWNQMETEEDHSSYEVEIDLP